MTNKKTDGFLKRLTNTLKHTRTWEDVSSILRETYHRRKNTQEAHTYSLRIPRYSDLIEPVDPLLDIIQLIEDELPSLQAMQAELNQAAELEKQNKTLKALALKYHDAKRVVTLPDGAAAVLRELTDFNEKTAEAKVVRRTMRRLQKDAREYLDGWVEENDEV